MEGAGPGQRGQGLGDHSEEDTEESGRRRIDAYAQGGGGDSATQTGQGVLGCGVGPLADHPQRSGADQDRVVSKR